MQIPSNLLLTRVRPSLYLPFWICVWSCISASTAAAKGYGSLIAVRACLGFAEAPYFPGAVYLLSSWYTKKELGLRITILTLGLVLATAFAGLIAAGIFAGLDGSHGIAGWQWLYIITGAANFLLGLVAFVVLPDFPDSKTNGHWLFTEEERTIAAERMRNDRIGHEHTRSILFGLRSAVTDSYTWIFVGCCCMCSNKAD